MSASGQRGTTLPRACAALVVSALVTTGCSNALTGDVALPTYGPVSTPPEPPPGSATLPADFPTEVPVPPGRYRVGPGPVETSWSLTITDVAPDALDHAERLLRDRGYRAEPVLGRDIYLGDRYVVTVSAESKPRNRLEYTVMDSRDIPGLPQLPRLDIPALIPAAG